MQRWRWALWMLAQACNWIPTPDDTDAVTTPGTDEDGDPGSSTSDDPPAVCPAAAFASIPGTLDGTTAGRPDDYTSTCGGDGSPDTTIAFAAPTTGRWVITSDSAFDSILSVFDGCGGVELACGAGAAEFVLGAGQSVIVVVEAEGAAAGAFQLAAFPGSSSDPEAPCDDGFDNDLDGDEDCADDDCRTNPSCALACIEGTAGSSVPVTVEGNTTYAVDDLAASCDLYGTNDLAFDFTAPFAGTFVFDATGSANDTVLYLLDGCGGEELACYGSTFASRVQVTADLFAGQTVIAVVAATSGPMSLTVTEQPTTEICGDGFDNDADGWFECSDTDCDPVCFEDCTNDQDDDQDGDLNCLDVYCASDAACAVVCPIEVASDTGRFTADTIGRPNATAGSCGGSEGSDWSIAFTAPTDGVYGFATIATLPWWGSLLYVLDGDCTGAELACDDAPNDNGDTVSVPLTAGQTVVVVVDSAIADYPGEFELLIARDVPSETICDDRLDDDFDGDVDCSDSDCDDDPTCHEDCGNQRDDDENGFVDCLDAACATDPICDPTCPETVLSGTGILTLRGNVEGRPDLFPGGSCGGAGPEQSIGFTAPADGDYAFAVEYDHRTNFSSVVYVLDGCGGPELACDDRPFANGGDIAVATLAAGQSVVAVVEAVDATFTGEFFLTVFETTPTETACGDGVDQDLDYSVDCDDSDCATRAACREDCSNGVDDDGDNHVDCMDSRCAADPACVATCPDAVVGLGTLLGSTRGRPDALSGTCEGAGAPDTSLAFTAPRAGDYTFTMNPEGTAYNSTLYLLDACGGAELACSDYYYPYPYDGDRITLPLAAGQDVVVVVDGARGDDGKFELQIFETLASEVVCDDRIDEDLDGLADCADPDCAASCAEDCANAVDDDDDGRIDCQDDACAGVPDCFPSCSDETVTSVPTVVVGSTVGRPDYDAPCGGASAASSIAFTAPADGEYGFGVSRFGTDLSAVLTLLDGCGGPVLGCERLSYGGDRVQTATMSAGDTVVAVIQGLSLEEAIDQGAGAFALQVFEVHPSEEACDDTFDDDADGTVDCQDDDCAASPGCEVSCPDGVIGLGTTFGSNLFRPDAFEESCGYGRGGSDQALSFTAPATGEYAFEVVAPETDFETYTALFDGCNGTELECIFYPEPLRVEMTAGQTVIAVVDGTGTEEQGTFALRVSEVTPTEVTCDDLADNDRDQVADCLDPDCAGDAACDCPERVLPAGLPVDVTVSEMWRYDASNVGSCGGGAYDLTFEFTAPAAGTYTIDTFGSTLDTVLYVTDGCGGAELACSDDAVGQGFASMVEVTLTAGQTVVVVLDTYDENDDDYRVAKLHIE